uniref:Integrase catalytic domain-containing protein n=1 Tax=Meloidogyne enterolobii TaxID=390850 RepID=A0A6V7XEY7_MELEN|nr:unnamed protein product [Meloidogyne enterolobii]
MKYEHERLLHSGVDATLGAFLTKFWAPCSRRDAKIIVKSCKKCQKIIGPTFSLPEMPNHPKERVCISRPFESVGIDYLGPSICKIDGNKQKFWIVLFTCFTTRAIHLEIAFELTALAFLHALRRFIAQRGVPAKIISDNANQFKVVSKSIDAKIVGKWSQDKQPENNKFNNFIINRGIEWKFIPALSPWQGGIYERLVKLVKDSFKKTLGCAILNVEELKTFIKEWHFVDESPALTYVSTESEGFSVLKPVDFIIPNIDNNTHLIEETEDLDEEYKTGRLSGADQLREKCNTLRKALERFWNRWSKEYLLVLREKSGWTHQNPRTSIKRDPAIGEVVVVQQEGQPRNSWTLGKIIELDGIPSRSAKILIGNKKLVRPINKLFPLEVNETSEPNDENNEKEKEKVEIKTKNRINNQTDNTNRNITPHPMITRSKKALLLQIVQFLSIFILVLTQERGPIRSCRGCKLICKDYGIKVIGLPETKKIEICCMGSCLLETNSINILKFSLPKDVTPLEYKCQVTFWDRWRKYRDRITCPPVDPCKRVEGFFERITNPQCESFETLILIGTFTGIILSISVGLLMFLCKLFVIFGWLTHSIWKIIKTIFRVFKGKGETKVHESSKNLIGKSKTGARNSKKIKRNRRLHKLGIIGLILFELIGSIICEIEVVSIQAKSEDCQRKAGSYSCKINTVNTLTMLPDGQVISLSIKNEKECLWEN